jgi:MoaA/NifB/PqqE/SkfB family radical SAM enzyme/pimeloyl-ACP methyl ester carboxylesterase
MNAGIVLVHGYSGSPGDLAPLAAVLRSRFGDAAVTVAALPGHTGAAAPSFDEELFKKTLAEIILPSIKEGKNLILVGHSTGGTLMLSLLAEKKIAPALLVLAAVPKRIDTTYLQRWSAHRTGKSSIAFGDIAAAISFINRTGGRRIAGSFPVLALHGTEDDLVPAADCAAWEEGSFEGPVRTVRIPGAGHHLFEGPGSAMALDVISRAAADACETEDVRKVLDELVRVETEAAAFLERHPHSRRHLAASASGRSVLGKKPDLAEAASFEPVFANIEVTTRCNLSCAYCARAFRRIAPDDMPVERFRNILALLPHAYRVTLVGLGEPLLHPGIADIVAAASTDKRRVGLVTNAMLLDDAAGQALLDAGLSSIAFSIDAADQETAQKLRPGTDLERVVGNIKAFTKKARALDRPVSTALFTAVSIENISGLGAVVDLAATLSVHVMMMTDLNFAENRERTLWKGGDDDARALLRQAVSRAFQRPGPLGPWPRRVACPRYDRFLLLPPDSLIQRSTKRTWCGSPWQTIPVNVKGEVTVCDCQPDAAVGDLLSLPFDAIWNGDTLREYRRRMLSDAPPGKCLLCPRF